MKVCVSFFTFAAICLCLSGQTVIAAPQPPAVGGRLPDIRLEVPQETEHQLYLGVDGKQTFAIPEIKAEVVLIEIFSMY
jgi:hypothetical protein